jgi:uncharacterized membrane protein
MTSPSILRPHVVLAVLSFTALKVLVIALLLSPHFVAARSVAIASAVLLAGLVWLARTADRATQT